MVADLILPGARQILLDESQGLMDVGDMAFNQELMFVAIKVLIVVSGFAEVEAGHPAMINCIMAAMDKIKKGITYQKIILASPVPRPYASRNQLKALFAMSKQIQKLCTMHDKFEFTKTGLLFYGPGGLYADLMDQQGLTQAGVKVMYNQLVDKLNSLGLTVKRQ